MCIRFWRVSVFLAVCSRQVMAYLLVLFSEWKKADAIGSCSVNLKGVYRCKALLFYNVLDASNLLLFGALL